jgi:hypothetical protein
MAYKLKKTMMLAAFFWAAHFIGPSLLPAARVAGEDVPVPTMTAPAVAAPRPDQSPPVVKRQEKKDAPAAIPQPVDKIKSSGQAPVDAMEIKTQPAPAVPPPGTFPARLDQTPAVKASGNAALTPAAVAATETKKPAAKSAPYVTIDFDNVDIQVFIKFVSELTGKNFVIDEKFTKYLSRCSKYTGLPR